MPEACQRVAGGRSAAQTPGQHAPPSRPRQGSHKPPKPLARTLTMRFDREPERRVRMAAQQPSLQYARTHIRPLSGTDAVADPTVGLSRSCGPRLHPRLLATVAPSGDAVPARQTPPGLRRKPFTTMTPRPGTPGDHSHSITGRHNRPMAQVDGSGSPARPRHGEPARWGQPARCGTGALAGRFSDADARRCRG